MGEIFCIKVIFADTDEKKQEELFASICLLIVRSESD
jgi:hypothetical protein